MATLGERLKELRAQRGFSQQELADRTDQTKQAISQYERGVRKPDIEVLSALCDIFNVSMDYLTGKADVTVRFLKSDDLEALTKYERSLIPDFPNIRPIAKKRYPVLGSVACGKPIYMAEEKEIYVDTTTEVKADFILIAKGDSMTGARINDGDIVFVHQQPEVENGEIAVVAIDDEATLKRFYKYNDMVLLKAENPEYKDMVYTPEDHKEVRVLGKAVAFQSDVR